MCVLITGEGGFQRSVSVCLFSARYLKTDAARITKHEVEMFYHESWKLIYIGVKRSKVKVTRQKCAIMGFFDSGDC